MDNKRTAEDMVADLDAWATDALRTFRHVAERMVDAFAPLAAAVKVPEAHEASVRRGSPRRLWGNREIARRMREHRRK